MKKRISKFIFLIFCTLTFSLAANATHINDDGDYEVNVDKFVPSKSVKIKESNLASKMENATRNAAYGNKQKKTSVVKRKNKQSKNTKSQVRSYKWF